MLYFLFLYILWMVNGTTEDKTTPIYSNFEDLAKIHYYTIGDEEISKKLYKSYVKSSEVSSNSEKKYQYNLLCHARNFTVTYLFEDQSVDENELYKEFTINFDDPTSAEDQLYNVKMQAIEKIKVNLDNKLNTFKQEYVTIGQQMMHQIYYYREFALKRDFSDWEKKITAYYQKTTGKKSKNMEMILKENFELVQNAHKKWMVAVSESDISCQCSLEYEQDLIHNLLQHIGVILKSCKTELLLPAPENLTSANWKLSFSNDDTVVIQNQEYQLRLDQYNEEIERTENNREKIEHSTKFKSLKIYDELMKDSKLQIDKIPKLLHVINIITDDKFSFQYNDEAIGSHTSVTYYRPVENSTDRSKLSFTVVNNHKHGSPHKISQSFNKTITNVLEEINFQNFIDEVKEPVQSLIDKRFKLEKEKLTLMTDIKTQSEEHAAYHYAKEYTNVYTKYMAELFKVTQKTNKEYEECHKKRKKNAGAFGIMLDDLDRVFEILDDVNLRHDMGYKKYYKLESNEQEFWDQIDKKINLFSVIFEMSCDKNQEIITEELFDLFFQDDK